jgi:hypothetical protein
MSDLVRYFDWHVVPNFRIYTEAENAVTSACAAGHAENLEAANRWALAAGMNASVPGYHMADAMFEERAIWPDWLPGSINQVSRLRQAIECRCCHMLRTESFSDDLTLLGAVVDAYKHTTLRDKGRHTSPQIEQPSSLQPGLEKSACMAMANTGGLTK